MKLTIRRGQEETKKGMRFRLSCQAEFTPEEKALVTKYDLSDRVLVTKEPEPEGFGDAFMAGLEGRDTLCVTDLPVVRTFYSRNVTALLEFEEDLKKACKAFKTWLTVMEGFGGEELVEF